MIVIGSLAVLAGGVQLVIACAGDEPDITSEPSFFMNSINNRPEFTPLFYDPYSIFYSNKFYTDTGAVDYTPRDENVRSWKNMTGKNVDDSDIAALLYRTDKQYIHRIYEHIRKDYTLSVPNNIAKNTFVKWLVKNNKHEQVLYLEFAKQCEPYAQPLESYWDDKKNEWASPLRDSAAMQELVQEGIKRHAAATDADLRMRYAYQTMRMAFYSREYPQTLTLFNELIPPGTTHYLFDRCLALKAGALFRTERKNEAAYLYSLVFDHSDEQKQNAMLSYLWASGNKPDNILQYCRNDHERAVLYLMSGMHESTYLGEGNDYNSGPSGQAAVLDQRRKATAYLLASLSTVYSYDPRVRGLDVLMTRNIIRLERSFLDDLYNAPGRSNDAATPLIAFAQKVAAENKARNKAFWLLSASYLSLLDGDIAGCRKLLDEAASQKMSPMEKQQHYLINTLHTIRKHNLLNAAAEQELLPMLQKLESTAANDRRYQVFFSTIMGDILYNQYLRQKDTVKALSSYSRSLSISGNASANYYSTGLGSKVGELLLSMHPSQLSTLINFNRRTDRTPFENWLVANTLYNDSYVYELQGTRFLSRLNFAAAASSYRNVDQRTLNETLLPDMFVSHLSEYTTWNRSDSAVNYNKLTFAQRMYELEQKLEKDPKDDRAAYQYANGLYSMSFYGKGSLASQYYRGSTDDAAYYITKARKKVPAADAEFYSVEKAQKYYIIAFNNSTDPEVKARCLFLAAKCWQKNCPVKDEGDYFSGDEKAYYLRSMKNPYFRQLRDEYAYTLLFKKAKGTCSYLQDYCDTRK